MSKLFWCIFKAILNGIVSTSSSATCFLLAYRKATEISKLILYPPTLLKRFSEGFFYWQKKNVLFKNNIMTWLLTVQENIEPVKIHGSMIII